MRQPLPRNVASLALNSPHGRSQHQLHIHVDCLRADVLQALDAHAVALGGRWAPLPVPLRGHQYQARLLPGAELTANPLNLLAYDLAGVGDVGQWSLVVAGREPVQAPASSCWPPVWTPAPVTRPALKSCRTTPAQC